jgi:thioredoxin 1
MTWEPVDESSFDPILESESRLVIAYFWGTNCPNCEKFARARPAVDARLAGLPVRLLKVNAYEQEALATRFGLHGIPTFLLFRDAKLLGKMTGFEGEEYFVRVIQEQLQKETDVLPSS